jgi:uncharacterized OB-fold protein
MPSATAVNRPYWEGCNRQELLLQRCRGDSCRKYVFYPRVCCPHCGGGDLEWVPASGRGKLVSYTKVHRPQHESFRSEIPIWFVAVHLEEGPILYSRLDRAPASEDGLIGRPVAVVFSTPIEGQRLPYVRLT